MEQKACAKCQAPILDSYFFCPNCGKKIKEPPLSTGIGKQLIIYAISIFLPPLGLWPGVKYVLAKDNKSRMIGFAALILTILSTVVSIALTISIINSSITQINQLNQINQVTPGTNEQMQQLQQMQKQGF